MTATASQVDNSAPEEMGGQIRGSRPEAGTAYSQNTLTFTLAPASF